MTKDELLQELNKLNHVPDTIKGSVVQYLDEGDGNFEDDYADRYEYNCAKFEGTDIGLEQGTKLLLDFLTYMNHAQQGTNMSQEPEQDQFDIHDVTAEQIYGALVDAQHNNLDGWDEGIERSAVQRFLNELITSAKDYPKQ
jgi:hypothetical protein